MNNPILDAIEAKLRSDQQLTYEDAADLFEHTVIGKAMMVQNKLTRDDVLVLVHQRFPEPAKLAESLRVMLSMFDAAKRSGMH